MGKLLFTTMVKVEAHPRAVYFARVKKPKKKGPLFEEVSQKVVKLGIEPVEGSKEGHHWLRRFDEKSQSVWSTRHPSLQETFWHAEWEYGIEEKAWKKEG